MRVLIPYTTRTPKSRLATILSAAERRAFSLAMLGDVVSAIRTLGYEPELLVTERVAAALDHDEEDTPTPVDELIASAGIESLSQHVDERPLSTAVNAALAAGSDTEQAIVMADLALATPTALQRLFATDGDVAIAPGRGGGTNALVVRDSSFAVDYHGASYRDHRRIAETAGLSVGVVDSMRLATDVDEPDDLAEVLLHGGGSRAREWLVDAGFEIDVAESGRVGVTRP